LEFEEYLEMLYPNYKGKFHVEVFLTAWRS